MRRALALLLLTVASCHGRGAAATDASPVGDQDAAPGEARLEAPAPAGVAAEGGPRGDAHPVSAVPLPPSPSSETYPLFRRTTLPVEDLARLVLAAPELARVGPEVAYFDPGDGSYIVRSTADHTGVAFSTQPVIWSPEVGQQVLVASARGRAASFVAAWWILPEGGYRLASAFVMLGEVAPVALAYKPSERGLWWTTCWQCPGETGHLSVREDHHVVIVQD